VLNAINDRLVQTPGHGKCANGGCLSIEESLPFTHSEVMSWQNQKQVRVCSVWHDVQRAVGRSLDTQMQSPSLESVRSSIARDGHADFADQFECNSVPCLGPPPVYKQEGSLVTYAASRSRFACSILAIPQTRVSLHSCC
jgi:hypothetical protein